MSDIRKLACVIKVPQEVHLQYSPEVMGTNPDESHEGMLAIVWEYETDNDVLIDSVSAKQHVLSSIETGMSFVPTEKYNVDYIASGIKDAVVKSKLLSEPDLNHELDDSVIQFTMADMSVEEFEHYNRPLEGVKFKFGTKP